MAISITGHSKLSFCYSQRDKLSHLISINKDKQFSYPCSLIPLLRQLISRMRSKLALFAFQQWPSLLNFLAFKGDQPSSGYRLINAHVKQKTIKWKTPCLTLRHFCHAFSYLAYSCYLPAVGKSKPLHK